MCTRVYVCVHDHEYELVSLSVQLYIVRRRVAMDQYRPIRAQRRVVMRASPHTYHHYHYFRTTLHTKVVYTHTSPTTYTIYTSPPPTHTSPPPTHYPHTSTPHTQKKTLMTQRVELTLLVRITVTQNQWTPPTYSTHSTHLTTRQEVYHNHNHAHAFSRQTLVRTVEAAEVASPMATSSERGRSLEPPT